MCKATNKFVPEVCEQTIRMGLDRKRGYPSRRAIVVLIAETIGCASPTLHKWVKMAEVYSGKPCRRANRDGRSFEGFGAREP
jgi:transposase